MNTNDNSYRYGFEGHGYDYPPGNSPRDGYGYDICVECHDLWRRSLPRRILKRQRRRLEDAWREELRKNAELGDAEETETEGEDKSSECDCSSNMTRCRCSTISSPHPLIPAGSLRSQANSWGSSARILNSWPASSMISMRTCYLLSY